MMQIRTKLLIVAGVGIAIMAIILVRENNPRSGIAPSNLPANGSKVTQFNHPPPSDKALVPITPRTSKVLRERKIDLLADVPLVDPRDPHFISQLTQLKSEDAGIVGTYQTFTQLDDQETRFLTELITIGHAALLTHQRKLSTKTVEGNKIVFSVPSYEKDGAIIRKYIETHLANTLGWGSELAAQYVSLLLPRDMQYFGKYAQKIVVEEKNAANKPPGFLIERSYTTELGPASSFSFIGRESIGVNAGQFALFLPPNQ